MVRLSSLVVGVILLSMCSRTTEAFGSYLDSIQPPQSDDTSLKASTASYAPPAPAPVRPLASASYDDRTQDLMQRYNLESLADTNRDVLKRGPTTHGRSEQPLPAASSLTGNYFESMTTNNSNKAPKKSYGPGTGDKNNKYKPVSSSPLNGFLSELSASSPSHRQYASSTTSPTRSSTSSLPIRPTLSSSNSQFTASHPTFSKPIHDSRNKNEQPSMRYTVESSSYSDSSSNAAFSSVDSKRDPAAAPTIRRVSSSDIDKILQRRTAAAAAAAAETARAPPRNAAVPLPVTTTAKSSPSSSSNFANKPVTSVKTAVKKTSPNEVAKFPLPPLPLPYDGKDERELNVNMKRDSFIDAEPLPVKLPQPNAKFQTVKYEHKPVGVFPAPPLPLALRDGEVTAPIRTVAAHPMFDRDIKIIPPKPQSQQKSSYYGMSDTARPPPTVTSRDGIRYIPRSDIFGQPGGAGSLRQGSEQERRRVIATSSTPDVDVTITTQGDTRQQRQSKRFEDRFNTLIQGNTERAARAREASIRRSQAMQTLATQHKERKLTRPSVFLGNKMDVSRRAHKAPAEVISDMTEAAAVQGGSLKTWSFKNSELERIHVALKTGGRPLNAELNLWRGPDDVPFKMRVYSENGFERPFSAVIETPHGHTNTVSVKNTGLLEFPVAAHVVSEEDEMIASSLPSARSSTFESNALTVHGGALKTFAFDASVESVQVLLRTDGLPINATIELLQGPTNSKQSIHVYSEEGSNRPLYMVIETPGNGNVIRVVNAAPIEFPLIASVEPYSIGQTLSPSEPVISGDVVDDGKDPDDTARPGFVRPGVVRRFIDYGRNRWHGKP